MLKDGLKPVVLDICFFLFLASFKRTLVMVTRCICSSLKFDVEQGSPESSSDCYVVNLISVVTIWGCPCVLVDVFCRKQMPPMTRLFSVQRDANFRPLSSMMPSPSLPSVPSQPVLSDPTLAFVFPRRISSDVMYMK